MHSCKDISYKYTIYEGGVSLYDQYSWADCEVDQPQSDNYCDIGGGSLRTHVYFIIIAWPSYQNLNSSYRHISGATPPSETSMKVPVLTLSYQHLDFSTTSENSSRRDDFAERVYNT